MSKTCCKWCVPMAAAMVVAGISQSALANTEPPAAYDARSVALGGTGAAYIHNGASVFHNPAALEGIEKFALTADLSLSRPTNTVPLNGPDTKVKSDPTTFPMFLIGGGYRLSKNFVVGLAVFPTAGFGSVYKGVMTPAGPVDLEQKMMMLETTPSLSFAITEGVAIGVGYRITYTTQTAEQLVPVGPPGPTGPAMGKLKVDLSGMNYTGAHIGLYLKPFKDTRIGLTYRNRFTTKLDGTVTINGASSDASTELPLPHSFRIGVAQGLLKSKLLLIAEVKRALYAEADKQLVTKIQAPTGTQEMVIPLDWRNTWTGGFGVEYNFPGDWALRLGYSLSQSASSEKRASYYFPPPTLLNTIHGGGGVRLWQIDLDLGVFYSFGGKDVKPLQDSPQASNPGRYETTFLMGALSATWRM